MHRGLFNSMDLDRDQNSADPTSSYSMQRAESNAADSATNSATSSSMQNESNAASPTSSSLTDKGNILLGVSCIIIIVLVMHRQEILQDLPKVWLPSAL